MGKDFILIYRISALELVEGGQTTEDILAVARAIEAAGATILNTGIGWHEARIPTIAQAVPRGGFAWVTRRLREAVKLPLIASNRINAPEIGEDIIARGANMSVTTAVPAWVSLSLGSAYFRSGRLADAEREYKATIEADRKSGEAYSNLAVVYLKTGRIAEAEDALARSRMLQGGH